MINLINLIGCLFVLVTSLKVFDQTNHIYHTPIAVSTNKECGLSLHGIYDASF